MASKLTYGNTCRPPHRPYQKDVLNQSVLTLRPGQTALVSNTYTQSGDYVFNASSGISNLSARCIDPVASQCEITARPEFSLVQILEQGLKERGILFKEGRIFQLNGNTFEELGARKKIKMEDMPSPRDASMLVQTTGIDEAHPLLVSAELNQLRHEVQHQLTLMKNVSPGEVQVSLDTSLSLTNDASFNLAPEAVWLGLQQTAPHIRPFAKYNAAAFAVDSAEEVVESSGISQLRIPWDTIQGLDRGAIQAHSTMKFPIFANVSMTAAQRLTFEMSASDVFECNMPASTYILSNLPHVLPQGSIKVFEGAHAEPVAQTMLYRYIAEREILEVPGVQKFRNIELKAEKATETVLETRQITNAYGQPVTEQSIAWVKPYILTNKTNAAQKISYVLNLGEFNTITDVSVQGAEIINSTLDPETKQYTCDMIIPAMLSEQPVNLNFSISVQGSKMV